MRRRFPKCHMATSATSETSVSPFASERPLEAAVVAGVDVAAGQGDDGVLAVGDELARTDGTAQVVGQATAAEEPVAVEPVQRAVASGVT